MVLWLFFPEAYQSRKSVPKKSIPKKKTTKEEAEKLIEELCNQFPDIIRCQKENEQVLISNRKDEGIGIITPKGKIKKLPAPLPKDVIEFVEEESILPVVQNKEPELLKEVQKASVATTKERTNLLGDIRKGIFLKNISGDTKKCPKGAYWSKAAGKCLIISKTKDDDIFLALQRAVGDRRGKLGYKE